MTQRDKIAAYLIHCGYVLAHKTAKRWIYTNPSKAGKVYLGAAGSFRYGASVVASAPVPERIKQQALTFNAG